MVNVIESVGQGGRYGEGREGGGGGAKKEGIEKLLGMFKRTTKVEKAD